MTLNQAIARAKRAAKKRGEKMYIVDDYIGERICVATKEDAFTFLWSEPVLAIVHPGGWVEQ